LKRKHRLKFGIYLASHPLPSLAWRHIDVPLLPVCSCCTYIPVIYIRCYRYLGCNYWGSYISFLEMGTANIARPTTARQNTSSWPNQAFTQQPESSHKQTSSANVAAILSFSFFSSLLRQQCIVFVIGFTICMFKISA